MPMAIPRHVREQGEAAERLQKQFIEGITNPDGRADDENTQPGGDNDAPARQSDQVDTHGAHQQEIEKWKSRYFTLKGKYDAEIPRLHDTIRTLQAELEKAKKGGGTDPEDDNEQDEFDPELAEFSDLANVVEKVIDKKLKPLTEQQQREREELERKAISNFWRDLTEAVPDWEEINESDDWKAWLAEEDEFAGVERQQLLRQAQSNLDAQRVAAFFRRFKETSTAQPSQGRTPHPPRSRGGRPPKGDEGGKKIWTSAEIEQFYSDWRRGKYRNNEQEARRMEAEIFAAQSEGRVR